MTWTANTDLPPPPAAGVDRPSASPRAKGEAGLWLWVGGAFCLLILVWAVFFLVARSARVESVPLAPKGARP